MQDRLRLTQAKMSDEVQLELLALWYTENTRESRNLDFVDAIPKYPFSVITTIPKPRRIEACFTLHGKKYLAEILPAQIKDARMGLERLVFPGAREELVVLSLFGKSRRKAHAGPSERPTGTAISGAWRHRFSRSRKC